MKNKNKIRHIKTMLTVVVCVVLTGTTFAQDALILTKKQEKHLSKTIINTHIMRLSTFSSFASYLYAADIAKIETDNPEVANVKLRSLPDPDKKVSLRELFEEIAKQTSSKWMYDGNKDLCMFTKQMPFEIEMARGWEKEIRQGYTFYKPPAAPVGMDIYIMGYIDATETPNDARMRLTKKFAEPFASEVTADSMKEVTLKYQNALFYKTSNTKKGVIWRQWAIVEKGRCFVIVSAIKPNDESMILPDVEKMVQSFRVINKSEK